MECVERIEHDRRRTGAGQSRRDFSTDVSGFPHTEDDHFSPSLDRCSDELDRASELLTEPLPQPLELGNFQIEHTCGLFNDSPSNV